MRLFTVKETATGHIAWEGMESTGGMVCMLPTDNKVGLPTLFVDWRALGRWSEEMPEYYISWMDLKV